MATPCRASGGGVRDAEHERTRATWSPHEEALASKVHTTLVSATVCAFPTMASASS